VATGQRLDSRQKASKLLEKTRMTTAETRFFAPQARRKGTSNGNRFRLTQLKIPSEPEFERLRESVSN
jgi:hypothetical protein